VAGPSSRVFTMIWWLPTRLHLPLWTRVRRIGRRLDDRLRRGRHGGHGGSWRVPACTGLCPSDGVATWPSVLAFLALHEQEVWTVFSPLITNLRILAGFYRRQARARVGLRQALHCAYIFLSIDDFSILSSEYTHCIGQQATALPNKCGAVKMILREGRLCNRQQEGC
jgi:hypothetical protein